MDRNTITTIVICLLCFVGLNVMVPKLFPPIKVQVQQRTNAAAGATGQAAVVKAVTNAAGVVTQVTVPNIATSATVTASSGVVSSNASVFMAADTDAPEQLEVYSNSYAVYTFTSRGGGVKTVDLVRYPETVTSLRKKKSTQVQDVATLNEAMPVAVGALLDDGTAAVDGTYQLTKTAVGVRAEKTLANGLSVVKTFTPGTNYLFTVSVRLENHGAAALNLPAYDLVVGSATPLGARDTGQFIGAMWSDGQKVDQTASQMWFANRSFLSCIGPTVPHTEYRGGSNNVTWVSAKNQFFAWVGVPETAASAVTVRPVNLPRYPELPADKPTPEGFQAALVYPAVKLAPGAVAENKLTVFAGPKEYRTLAAVSEQMNNNVDLVMGYGGFLGAFARGLLLAMNWLHDSFRCPYGWAIIAITVILKLIFWPLTAAGTRSMKRMSALQPQMKAIQEKYKDDPAKMNRKTMEFMKEHKLNPVGGCLPMLIQMPILFGFYRMIQSAIELRGAPFLWIGDLTQPDTLFIIPGLSFVPFFSIPGVGLPINLLPIIMVTSQVWQAHLTPPSPGMDPGQQKMMRYMPLMFLLFMYNMSAGLTLYWTVSNLLSIMQTKMTKTDPNDPLLALHPKKTK